MVPAVNVSAMLDGFRPPISEGSVAATTAPSRSLLSVATADGDRVTLSSNPPASEAVGYDARGQLGGADGAMATRSMGDAALLDGVPHAQEGTSVEYQTSISSLFAVQANGPSALPVRTGSVYIGTPPLAKAIDLLRSMMIAFQQSHSADTGAEMPTRATAPRAGGGMAAPPSDVAEA